jgi:Peptidase M1 N-terminal domain
MRKIIHCSIHQDPASVDLPKEISIRRVDRMIKKPLLVIHLQNTLKQGTVAEIEIDFNGQIWETSMGMFKGSYPEVGGEKRLICLSRP